MAGAERTGVFISYSHHDKTWLDALGKHRQALERETGISCWIDSQIEAGADWHAEIVGAIRGAKVAVFLISVDFCASDFIHRHELPALLAAAEREGLRILPVFVRPCHLPKALAKLQGVNKPDRTLSELDEAARQRAYMDIVAEIVRVVPTTAKTTTPFTVLAHVPPPTPTSTQRPASTRGSTAARSPANASDDLLGPRASISPEPLTEVALDRVAARIANTNLAIGGVGAGTGSGAEQAAETTSAGPPSRASQEEPVKPSDRWGRSLILACTVLAVAAVAAPLWYWGLRNRGCEIHVTVEPPDGLRVTVGGVPRDREYIAHLVGPPGEYAIVVERDGYLPWSENIILRTGTTEKRSVTLEPVPRAAAPAPVAPVSPEPVAPLVVPPTATAAAAGEHRREADPQPAARHSRTTSRRDSDRSQPTSQDDLPPQPSPVVEPKPEPPPAPKATEGFLRLGSKPWTKIAVDGRDTDLRTPQQHLRLTAGTHRVTLSNPQFGVEETFTVEILGGETETVNKDLRPKIEEE